MHWMKQKSCQLIWIRSRAGVTDAFWNPNQSCDSKTLPIQRKKERLDAQLPGVPLQCMTIFFHFTNVVQYDKNGIFSKMKILVINPNTSAAMTEAIVRDRSGAIVLGCAGMAPVCRALQERLGVPVIDGVAAAIKFAESLVCLGLGTSKHGDYARPLPKKYLGWAATLGWD